MVMGPSQLVAHTLSYFVLPKCKKWAASYVGEQQSKVEHLETLWVHKTSKQSSRRRALEEWLEEKQVKASPSDKT